MKYDTLKKRVAQDAYTSVMYGKNQAYILLDLIRHPMNPRVAIQECADLVFDTIMNWDIRLVGKLRALFPDSFPRNMRKGNLVCDYNTKGDWVVYPQDTQ